MDLQNTGNAPSVEIVRCIKEAGLQPDHGDLSQLAEAVRLLGGLPREEIQKMIDRAVSPFLLCEFYFFRSPVLRTGFLPAHGDLVESAAALYPEAWAYLQTPEGRLLCKTEEEWQAMSTASWATLADGTKVGWEGCGGVPFYAPDLGTGALRLPDLRGMYAEAAGFDALSVGGVHGDAIRNVTGTQNAAATGFGNGAVPISDGYIADGVDGVFRAYKYIGATNTGGNSNWSTKMDLSRVVPVAAKNQGRAWGALASVYLGLPAL